MNQSPHQFGWDEEPRPKRGGGQGIKLFFLGLGATAIVGVGLIGWEAYGDEAKYKWEDTVRGVKQFADDVQHKMNPEWMDNGTVYYTFDAESGGFRLATGEEIEEHKQFEADLHEAVENNREIMRDYYGDNY